VTGVANYDLGNSKNAEAGPRKAALLVLRGISEMPQRRRRACSSVSLLGLFVIFFCIASSLDKKKLIKTLKPFLHYSFG
jgi:hypothetical protein